MADGWCCVENDSVSRCGLWYIYLCVCVYICVKFMKIWSVLFKCGLCGMWKVLFLYMQSGEMWIVIYIYIYMVKVILISARCDTVFHISGYFTIIYSDVCCELG